MIWLAIALTMTASTRRNMLMRNCAATADSNGRAGAESHAVTCRRGAGNKFGSVCMLHVSAAPVSRPTRRPTVEAGGKETIREMGGKSG